MHFVASAACLGLGLLWGVDSARLCRQLPADILQRPAITTDWRVRCWHSGAHGLLFALAGAWQGMVPALPWLLLFLAIGGCLLLIDWQYLLLPDRLTLTLLWAGLLRSALGMGIAPGQAILAAAIAWLALRLPAWIARHWQQDSPIGQGDAKLLAALAAWCGLPGLLPILFVAALLTLLLWWPWRWQHAATAHTLPFGPGLLIGGLLVLLQAR